MDRVDPLTVGTELEFSPDERDVGAINVVIV